jgi:lipopolysaccharide export system protein LptA
MKSKKTGKTESNTITYNIREERMKVSQENKKSVDEVMDSAKKHFEEIFNRL